MPDKYPNFAVLAISEPAGHWRIVHERRARSRVLIVAPHGGRIEPFTSELAVAIAGDDCSVYCFEGRKPKNNGDLHITSHHFDEPIALALAAESNIVVGVHGCAGENAIYVGGLDKPMAKRLTTALVDAGLPAIAEGHRYPGIEPNNICNRGRRRRGVQLEITRDLRSKQKSRDAIAAVTREVVDAYRAEMTRSLITGAIVGVSVALMASTRN